MITRSSPLKLSNNVNTLPNAKHHYHQWHNISNGHVKIIPSLMKPEIVSMLFVQRSQRLHCVPTKQKRDFGGENTSGVFP